MKSTKECEVCSGDGRYPIIDCYGTDRYSIQCPECFGSGLHYGDDELEGDSEKGVTSTAARITTMDEMREHIRKHWSER